MKIVIEYRALEKLERPTNVFILQTHFCVHKNKSKGNNLPPRLCIMIQLYCGNHILITICVVHYQLSIIINL